MHTRCILVTGDQTCALPISDAILDRRDKMGFVTAQEDWMRTSLAQEIEECFSAEDFPLEGLVSQAGLVQAFSAWRHGQPTLPQQDLFRLFILARWMKRFEDKEN